MLHGEGLSSADSIFVATMYALGSIIGVAVTAPVADRLGVERVLACILGLGAGCMLLVGIVALPYAALCIVIGGVGIGIGGGRICSYNSRNSVGNEDPTITDGARPGRPSGGAL